MESTCEKSSTVPTDPPTNPTDPDPTDPDPTEPPTEPPTSSPDTECNCGKANPTGVDSERIIGGTEAVPNEFPWVVRVQAVENIDRRGAVESASCGGAIISPKIVLTAGHCIVRELGAKDDYTEPCKCTATVPCANTNFHCYKTIKVLAGVHRIGKEIVGDNDAEEKDLNVEKIILHKDYEAKTGQGSAFIHDLAILELKRSIEFMEKMRPICLPSGSPNYEGKMATTAGWGWTDGRVIPYSLFNNKPYTQGSDGENNPNTSPPTDSTPEELHKLENMLVGGGTCEEFKDNYEDR